MIKIVYHIKNVAQAEKNVVKDALMDINRNLVVYIMENYIKKTKCTKLIIAEHVHVNLIILNYIMKLNVTRNNALNRIAIKRFK